MGKTIQAGLAIRQTLIDAPGRTVGVIAPDSLTAHWRAELRDRLFLDDFPTQCGEPPYRIIGHDNPLGWVTLADVDILVVDEGHLLDPDLFRWDQMDAFSELLEARRELAPRGVRSGRARR